MKVQRYEYLFEKSFSMKKLINLHELVNKYFAI